MRDFINACLELKSAPGDDGTFEGYASTFGNVDEGRDVVVKGAFSASLQEHSDGKTMPAMFYSHDVKEPVGDWLEMREDDRGLYAKGRLWVGKGIPKAEQAHMMLKGTGMKGLSIGYAVPTGGSSIDHKAGVRYLKRLDLYETSPTPFPMNRKAKIVSIKAAAGLLTLTRTDGQPLTKREMEAALRDAGLSDRQAKGFIAQGYSALANDPRDEDAIERLARKLDDQIARTTNHTR